MGSVNTLQFDETQWGAQLGPSGSLLSDLGRGGRREIVGQGWSPGGSDFILNFELSADHTHTGRVLAGSDQSGPPPPPPPAEPEPYLSYFLLQYHAPVRSQWRRAELPP